MRYDIELEDPQLVLGTKEFTIRKPDQNYRVILRPRKTGWTEPPREQTRVRLRFIGGVR